MNRTRRLTMVLLAALFLGACGSTTADTIGLHYNDGPLEGESFEGIVQPGSGQKGIGPFDRIVRLPINQREYTFCADVRTNEADGCDAPPIIVTALGGAELAFSGGVTFELNTGNEETVKQFYEEVCRKFECANEDGVRNDGWDEMLRVNMRGPIEDSLQEEIRGYSVDALYAGIPAEGEELDEDEALSTLSRVSDDLAASLRKTINDYSGGQFFCGPAYDRSKPDECPDFEFIITEVTPSAEVKAAFDKNVASRQAVIDARNRAEAERVAAEGVREAQEALDNLYTDAAYIEYQRALALLECAKNTNCTLIFGDTGGGVNVTPRPPQQ